MDLLAQEYKGRPQEADRLAAAESHILDESEQGAAGPQAEDNLGKHRILGWVEGRYSRSGLEHPAEVGCMADTAPGPPGHPHKHAAAQLLGLI